MGEERFLRRTCHPIRLACISRGLEGSTSTSAFEIGKMYKRLTIGLIVCVLEFGVGELGSFTLRCERPFTPLRWALRRESVTDTLCGSMTTAATRNRPTSQLVLLSRLRVTKKRVPFEAEIHVHRSRWDVSSHEHQVTCCCDHCSSRASRQGFGFSALGINPEIEHRVRSPDSAVRIVDIAGLWSRARLPGNLLAVVPTAEGLDHIGLANSFALYVGITGQEPNRRLMLPGETMPGP